MWPPRFGQGVPAPPIQPRPSVSTAPRRPSHLGPNANTPSRPSFGARSSSLNISAAHNVSTTSLNSTRSNAGSGLRREVVSTADVRDPLLVLSEILGSPLPEISDTAEEVSKPVLLTGDIDFKGSNLQEFIHEKSVMTGTGFAAEEPSSQSDGRELQSFEELHQSILACNEVLRNVEISLANFQNELGTVSAEIETLQNRSTSLNTKLENRKVVERLLGPAVEEVSIPPAVIRKLLEASIDAEWGATLNEFDRQSQAIATKAKASDKVAAVADVGPLLSDLTNMAIERIRDYFVAQIKALRSPNINAQIIQQRAFISHRDLYAFLQRRHPQLAEEIMQAYGNTMRWYYLSHFTRYKQALEKMPLYNIDKSDGLGVEQVTQRGTSSSSTANMQKSSTPLSIGRRMEVLNASSNAALPSYVAAESKTATYMETPFSAYTTALTDNASAEYTFLTNFFPFTTPFAALSRHFNHIFGPTFELGHAFTKQLVDNTYDCLGLLLCIRITQHHAFTLQRRKCPVAEGWINGTNMLLWPRFQLAMDVHTDSVKKVSGSGLTGSRATLSLTSTKGEDSKGSVAPHPVTQRFGQLLQGILALSNNEPTPTHDDPPGVGPTAINSDIEPVGRSLDRVRSEVDAFLHKASKGLTSARKERFLSNNYSLILTIIGDTGGSLAQDQRAWFEEKRDNVAAS